MCVQILVFFFKSSIEIFFEDRSQNFVYYESNQENARGRSSLLRQQSSPLCRVEGVCVVGTVDDRNRKIPKQPKPKFRLGLPNRNRKYRTEIQLLKYIDFGKCLPIFGKIYDKKSFLFNFAKEKLIKDSIKKILNQTFFQFSSPLCNLCTFQT